MTRFIICRVGTSERVVGELLDKGEVGEHLVSVIKIDGVEITSRAPRDSAVGDRFQVDGEALLLHDFDPETLVAPDEIQNWFRLGSVEHA